MNNSFSLFTLAHILGCGGLAELTGYVAITAMFRQDKSPRSASDKFAEELSIFMLGIVICMVAMVEVTVALDAHTNFALVLAYGGSAMLGPVLVGMIRPLNGELPVSGVATTIAPTDNSGDKEKNGKAILCG